MGLESAVESSLESAAVVESSLESAAVLGVDYRWTPRPGPVGVHGEVVGRPEPEVHHLGQWPPSTGLLTPCLACSPSGA